MTSTFDVPEQEIIEWRRQIHERPELSFEEHRTAAFVAETLRSFGRIWSDPSGADQEARHFAPVSP